MLLPWMTRAVVLDGHRAALFPGPDANPPDPLRVIKIIILRGWARAIGARHGRVRQRRPNPEWLHLDFGARAWEV
jgi:hypothetical protein